MTVMQSWQHSYIIYLLLFTWWQHHFDINNINTQTHTQRQTHRQTGFCFDQLYY